MVRKKKKSNNSFLPKMNIIIGITMLVVVVAIGFGARHFALHSNYFKVTSIVIEPTLQFIDKKDLISLKNKSIFAVDLQNTQRRLNHKYPQVSKLRIIRSFPNRIVVAAQKRMPIAQIILNNKVLTLDGWGIVLSTTSKRDDNVPFINGTKNPVLKFNLGMPIKSTDIQTALKIIRFFKDNRNLGPYQMIEVDVSNLSKIVCSLSREFQVILDREHIQERIGILALVLTRAQLDLDEVKYIDLRFKEPIIGKK